MGSRPSDLFGTLDADALARATAEMFRAQATESPMNPWPYVSPSPAYIPPIAPSLTEADVRRLVREEIEASRPVPSVLDVTPEDVKRWLPRG